MPANPDVLQNVIDAAIFREIAAAPAPVVRVVNVETRETLTFTPTFQPADANVERDHHGWPVCRWRGKRTA